MPCHKPSNQCFPLLIPCPVIIVAAPRDTLVYIAVEPINVVRMAVAPPLASDRTDVFFNHLHIFFNLLGSTQESVTGAGSIPLHLYPFGKCGQLEDHLKIACDVDEQREEF